MTKRIKTDEELRQLAVDIIDGKVFTSDMIRETDLSRSLTFVFFPLLFLEQKDKDELIADNAVVFYEYYDKAGLRGMNGYPIFMSFAYLTRDESNRCNVFFEEYLKIKETFMQKKEGQ